MRLAEELSQQFNKMFAKVGRPLIPQEQLLRAQLLQMLYSVRSERLLMEEMDYNILSRWFVGLNTDDAVGAREGSVSRLLGNERHVAASRVTLLAGIPSTARRGCKFVRIPSVATIWRAGVRNITLPERKYLAAPLTTTLRLAVHGPMNRGRSIKMRNCIGLHDIEMLVGAKKPYVTVWHSNSSKLLALRELKE